MQRSVKLHFLHSCELRLLKGRRALGTLPVGQAVQTRSWNLKPLSRLYWLSGERGSPAIGANQAGRIAHLCWLPLKLFVGSVHSREVTLFFNEKVPPHFLPCKYFNMLRLGAEMLLKIKLLLDVVFLIHFNFIIQHGDVDHKCEIQ